MTHFQVFGQMNITDRLESEALVFNVLCTSREPSVLAYANFTFPPLMSIQHRLLTDVELEDDRVTIRLVD